MVMDLQSYMRMMNLFPPMAQNGIDTSNRGGSIPNEQPSDTMQSLNSAYTPRHAISDQLTSTLSNMPVRPEVSGIRAIGSAIAGLGAGSSPQGIVMGQPIGFHYNPLAAKAGSDEITDQGYDKKLSDWENKTKALTIGANEEDKSNTNERIRANNVETQRINEEKAKILEERAKTYDLNAHTKIQEEVNKHASAMQRHSDNIAKLDQQLMIAKQNYDLKKNSTEAMQKYHDAELASIDARRKAQTEDDNFKLEDQKRRTDAMIEHNRIIAQGNTTTTNATETRDSAGNITGINRTTTKVPGVTNSSNILTDPDGKQHDVSTWSANDLAQAKLRGWK